jgi:large subunit ribosomal protein L17
MVIRQQVSDVIAYGHIKTTFVKAKETQRHVDRLITLAKTDTLASKRRILSIIKDTKNANHQALLKKLGTLSKKYASRHGGYTRVLKIGKRPGDNTELAVIELV